MPSVLVLSSGTRPVAPHERLRGESRHTTAQLFPADLDASVFGRCPSGSGAFGGTDMPPATKQVTKFTFQSVDHRERNP